MLRAFPGEVWSVQGVKAPFYHFDNGNADSGGESKKQNELDEHFFGFRRCGSILIQQQDPSTISRP